MAAAEQLITANLDIWSSAVKTKSAAGRGSSKKLDLYGIKKLRELILELAVRGLLVPQDPNDEPASELLKKIAAEKAKLVRDGKIRKQKALPPVEEDEQLFKLPIGWEWCRLADTAFSQAGFAFKSKSFNELGEGLPLIRIRDVGQPFSGTFYDAEYREEFVVKEGDYLISMDGNFRVAPWEGADALLNQRVSRLIFFGDLLGQRFIAESLQLRLLELQGVKAYTTVDHLSGGQISSSVIALPPSKEQYRIVAKVDELMALCDQLEQQQESSITAHQTLVQTLLDALTTATERDGFTAAWARIADHFDNLFTTEWSIDQLKQTILQLAVMGKLVPQDPNDEPASELLKKIAAEKAQLVKDKKIKKQKAVQQIEGDEKPFDLPEGWEWVRLQSVTSKITDGDHKTPPRIEKGRRLLSAKNVRDGFVDFDICDFISEESYEKSRERCLPEEGDLLIVSVGGTIGRSSLVPSDSDFALVRSVALVKPLSVRSKYLKCSMDSKLLQDSIHSRKRGGAQPCLYLSEISQFPFSVPPIQEQNRIVAKVDELMALCGTLRTRLNTAQTTQLQLADAMAASGSG